MKRRVIIKETLSTLMCPKICFACEKFMNQISSICRKIPSENHCSPQDENNHAFLFNNGGYDEFLDF